MNDDDFYDPTHRLPRDPALPPEKALQVIHERPPSLQGVNVHLVRTMDDVGEFKRWLGERREGLAVDTETTGFNAWDGEIRLCQFGDAMTGWAIPWDDYKGVCKEVLNTYDDPLIFHNSAFDVRWLRVHGDWDVPWHRIHDTMIGAHIIDPTQSVALKNLAVRLVDKRANAGEELLKKAFHDNKWDWSTVPIDYDAYWAYGALDCVLTARLFETLRAQERYPRVYELEMATRRVASNMEDNGSPIDIEYCEKKFESLTEYVEKTKQWFADEMGVANANSAVQLIRFFESRGGEITRTTASGNKSCDKTQLKLLAQDDPLAKTILDMRKAEKLANTYFKNFLEKNVDGILHPSIRTLGARTGRMSMTDPALQTLPKGEATVRDAFVPRDGHVLLTCDYDQIEMRLLAHFSGDPGLIAAFGEQEDFFVSLARQIWNDPSITKSHPLRTRVKGVAYGKAYGAGVTTMAETAGIPYDQMNEAVKAFDARFPGVLDFQKAVEQIGLERLSVEGVPYVITPFGRRLLADRDRAYTLVNYLLQSHAAEILKEALVRLDMAGLGDYLLLPVHDEVIMSVPKEDAEEIKRVMQECMEVTDTTYKLPLTAGASGPLERWGDNYR